MATVSLVFAGSSDQLDKTFSSIEANTKNMAKTVGAQSSKVAKSFDKMGAGADNAEGPVMGLADVLDGLGSAFGLPTEGATKLARAAGDLTGGFAQLGPLIGKVLAKLGAMIGITTAQAATTTGAAAAQWNLNAAMLANPVGAVVLAIAALVAIFVVLWNKVDGFRDALKSAWRWVEKSIPGFKQLGAAIGWVTGLFSDADDKVGAVADAMAEHAAKIDEAVLILSNGVGVSREAWKKWSDQIQQSLEDILDPLKRARDESKVSFAELEANLEDNQRFFEGWVANLAILTERGFGDLALEMQQLGPAAEKAVGEMIHMSDRKLAGMQALFKERGATIGGEGVSAMQAAIAGADWSGLGRMIADVMGVNFDAILTARVEETLGKLRAAGATIGVTMAPAAVGAPAQYQIPAGTFAGNTMTTNNFTINAPRQADPEHIARAIMWNLN
ncbi:MAG: hypothetical protein ACRDYV_00230 [Acidimicrobiia bacterium]